MRAIVIVVGFHPAGPVSFRRKLRDGNRIERLADECIERSFNVADLGPKAGDLGYALLQTLIEERREVIVDSAYASPFGMLLIVRFTRCALSAHETSITRILLDLC